VADQAHVAEQEVHIFRYPLTLGSQTLLRISALSGDVDVYVWDPAGASVIFSEIDSPFEEISFLAATPGVYQIEIEGYTSADYHLQVIPLSAIQLQLLPQNGINTPTPRGRGAGINSSIPGENTGLPAVPLAGNTIYLPLMLR
jgi:hypothetical protein